jgi:hypothetical protein
VSSSIVSISNLSGHLSSLLRLNPGRRPSPDAYAARSAPLCEVPHSLGRGSDPGRFFLDSTEPSPLVHIQEVRRFPSGNALTRRRPLRSPDLGGLLRLACLASPSASAMRTETEYRDGAERQDYSQLAHGERPERRCSRRRSSMTIGPSRAGQQEEAKAIEIRTDTAAPPAGWRRSAPPQACDCGCEH